MDEAFEKFRDLYCRMLCELVARRYPSLGVAEMDQPDRLIPEFLERGTCMGDLARRERDSSSCVVLSGFNGVGKDTIGQKLVEAGFPRLPNVTTRKPRPSEREGVDYFFFTEDRFHEAREAGEFITCMRRHGADWHGFLRKPFVDRLRKGEAFYLDKSPSSWKALLEAPEIQGSSYTAVYILPPSFDEWLRRLLGRTRQTSGESVGDRLEDSLQNFQIVIDFPELYNAFVVNDDFSRAADVVLQFFRRPV
jgi:guanylate kinase